MDPHAVSPGAWAAAGLLVLGLWAFHLTVHLPVGMRAPGWDGPAYLDCAHSIAQGRGFLIRRMDYLGPEAWDPIRLWPPGYPLLIAGLLAVGVPPYEAGLAVSALAGAIAALLILYLSVRSFRSAVGVPLALLIISLPSYVLTGTSCFSEAPYTVLLLLSLLCLLRGTRERPLRASWILCAGLLAGMSWCVRNVAVAVFAASLCYLLYWSISHRSRRGISTSMLWLVGWFCGSGWLIWRNLRAFGHASPYNMGPSERPFLVNLWDTCYALALEFTGARALARALCSPYGLLAIGAASAGLLGVLVLRRHRRSAWSGLIGKDQLVLLGLVAVFHIGLVVAARTAYRWGEPINGRYLSPVGWALAFLAVAGTMAVLSRLGVARRAVTILLVVTLACSGVVQIRRQFRLLPGSREQAWPITPSEVASLCQDIPADKFVLSDIAHFLSILGNVDARYLRDVEMDEIPSSWEEIAQLGEHGRLWGIVIGWRTECDRGRYGEPIQALANRVEDFPPFRATKLHNGGLVLIYDQAEKE